MRGRTRCCRLPAVIFGTWLTATTAWAEQPPAPVLARPGVFGTGEFQVPCSITPSPPDAIALAGRPPRPIGLYENGQVVNISSQVRHLRDDGRIRDLGLLRQVDRGLCSGHFREPGVYQIATHTVISRWQWRPDLSRSDLRTGRIYQYKHNFPMVERTRSFRAEVVGPDTTGGIHPPQFAGEPAVGDERSIRSLQANFYRYPHIAAQTTASASYGERFTVEGKLRNAIGQLWLLVRTADDRHGWYLEL